MSSQSEEVESGSNQEEMEEQEGDEQKQDHAEQQQEEEGTDEQHEGDHAENDDTGGGEYHENEEEEREEQKHREEGEEQTSQYDKNEDEERPEDTEHQDEQPSIQDMPQEGNLHEERSVHETNSPLDQTGKIHSEQGPEPQQQPQHVIHPQRSFADSQEVTYEETLMEKDADELQEMLEQRKEQVRQLELEQEIFESYLRRHVDPNEDLFKQAGEDMKKDWRKKRGKGKQKGALKLTIDQKLEIASSELDHKQKENQQMDRKYNQMIETLQAVLEQTNIRIRELEREGYEFRRDIVQGAENPRTGQIIAEKIVKYLEDRLKSRDALVEKLRLKNTSLRNSIKKAETQLRQKEEMGDVLHYIDFHQLQIENKQYLQKIEEKNQQLLHLKMSTGQTVQTLNALKHRLNTLLAECSWRRQEITTRRELLQRLKQDNDQVEREVRKGESHVQSLSGQLAATENLPKTMDYVEQKEQMQYLEKELANWERKLEINEMALKRARGLYKKAVKTAEAYGMKISEPDGHNLSASMTWASEFGGSVARTPVGSSKQNSRVGMVPTPFGQKTRSGLYKGKSLSRSISRQSSATEKI